MHHAIETPSIFAPVSTPAFAIRDLSFFVLAITAAFFGIVAGLAVYTLVRFGLFWRPVILARPAKATWPRWAMIPYLALAMFQSLPLAAILTFSDRVIYARYSSVEDQALAGVIMWVPGSIPLRRAVIRAGRYRGPSCMIQRPAS